MGQTDSTALTSTFADNVEQGRGSLKTVKSGAMTILTANPGETLWITLDEPFLYNGVDNLIVEFLLTEACDGDVNLHATESVYENVSLHNWSTTITGGGLYNNYLNTKFYFEGGDNTLHYGGSTGNNWPFSSELPRIQNLIVSDDIDGSGPITGIAFQLQQPSSEETYTYSLRMGHTTLAALGTNYDDNYNVGSPVTLASNATFTVPAGIPAGEWFWVPLPDSLFPYNGSDNLIVEVEVTAGSGDINLMITSLDAGIRAIGYSGSEVAEIIDTTAYHIKLRFNGGPIDVITDGGGSYAVPVASNFEFIEQILYDNTAMGTGGKITELAFRLDSDANAVDHSNVHVVLGHTTLSSLGGTSFSANITSDLTEAYSDTISIPAGPKAGDWITIPLTTPFTYDPTKNLVVQWDAPSYPTPNISLGHTYDTGRYIGHVVSNFGDRTSDAPTGSEDFILDMRLTIDK
jgi:hypothetical protein